MPEATTATAATDTVGTPSPVVADAAGAGATAAAGEQAAEAKVAEGAPSEVAATGDAAAADASKATEAKATEGEAAADKAAPELELSFPEGAAIDPAALETFKALAKEHGLNSKQAQALADFDLARQAAAAAADEKQRAQWKEQLRADKQIGGANFEANAQIARKAMVAFGDSELKEMLSHGLGDHPAMVRAFHRIAKAIGEDSLSGTGAEAVAPKNLPFAEDREAQRQAYPSMFPAAG